jgi:hypothetical protein
MTEQAAATGSFTPVRCAVTVPLSPERAFAQPDRRAGIHRRAAPGPAPRGPALPVGRDHGVITMGRGDSQYAHQPVPG